MNINSFSLKKYIVLLFTASLLMIPIKAIAEELEYSCFIFPPYMLNKQMGIADKTAKLILERANIDVVYRYYPWARHLENLSSGKSAMGNYGYPEGERDKHSHLYFPTENNVPITVMFGTMQPLERLPTMEELVGKRVGLLRNSVLGPYVGILDPASGVGVQKVQSFVSGFKMLQLGRIDYFVSFLGPTIQIKSTTNQFDDIKFKKIFTMSGIVITISKAHPRGQELYERISKATKELEEEGVIDIKTGLIKGFDYSKWEAQPVSE